MNNRGLTLVELLISVALGSLLCLAAVTLMARFNKAFLQDEQVERTQENGRYALRLLSRELSMAGYFGEMLPRDIAPAEAAGTLCYRHLVQFLTPLEHYDNLSSRGDNDEGNGIPEGCKRAGSHQLGADALLIRRTMDLPAIHWGERLAATEPDMLYLRAEAGRAELVRGTDGLSVEGSLWRYHPQLFFLRNYSRYRGDGIPTLCRIRLSPQAQRTAPVECLVEGVEQMQVQFGVDSDGDRRPDRFLLQPTTAEMGRAVVVKIQLLLRSPLPLPGHRDNNSYSLANFTVSSPGDRFYRRLMSTTVRLRNSDVLRP